MKERSATLEHLAEIWRQEKDAEDSARNARLVIEQKMADLMPGPDEGTVNYAPSEHGIKVSVTRKLTRTIDLAAYKSVRLSIPTNLTPVKFTSDLDLKKYRAVETANPDIFRLFQRFIFVKPAKKPGIRVTEVKV